MIVFVDNTAMQSYTITAVYKFIPIANVEATQQAIDAKGQELNLIGLFLVAAEGINGTVAGSTDGIAAFQSYLTTEFGELVFKDSIAETKPFKRWLVKIRSEIVGLGDPELHPETDNNNHITPEEWNRMMADDDVVIIDTRNDYEYEVGTFEGAINPNLKQFNEWPDYVKESGIPKDKKVLMFCTGGIRCEKASLEMQRQGYKDVYQLKGGILQYLKECPNQQFKGECFVFDHRCSVDQNLQPSERYALCPHTGDPADTKITCRVCGNTAKVHASCENEQRITCSKDCAHRLQRDAKKADRMLAN